MLDVNALLHNIRKLAASQIFEVNQVQTFTVLRQTLLKLKLFPEYEVP
jgi:hypothetical protein